MSAAAGSSPLAPPGRSHLRSVPADHPDHHVEDRVPMARSGSPLPDPHRQALAMRIQGLFLKRGQSLAHPATADVHRTSMESMRLILSGALANGVIDDRQHTVLAGMVDDVEAVPECL